MYSIALEKFSGPLDLLLQLIDDQKMEITEVSIAMVTEQYIKHLSDVTDIDPEELSDFLVLATRLLLLKSKAILPEIEQEETFDDLEKQLKIYKEFLEATKKMAARLREEHFSFARQRPPVDMKVTFSPAANMTLDNLRTTFLAVLKRLDPIMKLPKQLVEKTVSLQQKMAHLKDLIARKKSVGFKSLLETAQSKTEVIVNFLAMLELVKQQCVVIEQGDLFDDIVITKVTGNSTKQPSNQTT